jgi:PAS domain S-box-containing protein
VPQVNFAHFSGRVSGDYPKISTMSAIPVRFVRFLAFLPLIISLLVFYGWAHDFVILKSMFPGYTTMKANTAVCVFGSALFLLLSTLPPSDRFGNRLLYAAVLLPFVVSALTLSEYIGGFNLGIDQLFFTDHTPVNTTTPFPGRMSQTTAICFMLLQIAFLGVTRGAKVRLWAQRGFQWISVIAAIALIGYALHVPGFYSLAFFYSMALPTAVCLLLLSVAATALVPESGCARLFLGKGIGNVVSRRFFPFMFFSVLGLSMLCLEMYRLHVVNIEMGVGLAALFLLVLTLVIVNRNAEKLNQLDDQRSRAEQQLRALNSNLETIIAERTRELRESNRRNQIFVNGAPSAIAMFDTEMRYIAASNRWIKDYQLEGKPLIGRSHYEVFPEIGAEWKRIHQESLAGAVNKNNCELFRRADGVEMWLMWDVRPWYVSEGRIGGILMYTADISELVSKEQEIRSLLSVTNDQNERLRNFAHIVSHNLRSHAGNISMLLDILSKQYPTLAEEEMIRLLHQSSENLKETIGHLNEVVAINTGTSAAFKSLFPARHVERAIQTVSALANKRKVTVRNLFSSDKQIWGYEAYLDSIVLNMLTNAIKYSDSKKEDPFVSIEVEERDEYLVLIFRDNGIGMNLNLVGDRLFGMYKTFHDHPDARGVGLFITRNQVEALGGKIEVESAVGRGTTFYVHLKAIVS